MSSPVDPRRCPLCQGENACGQAAGLSSCWCMAASVPAEVLERVPAEARDVACVCSACAARESASSEPALSTVAGDRPLKLTDA